MPPKLERAGPAPEPGDVVLDPVHGLWQYGRDGNRQRAATLAQRGTVILRARDAQQLTCEAFDLPDLGLLRANGLMLWLRSSEPLRKVAVAIIRDCDAPEIRTVRRILKGVSPAKPTANVDSTVVKTVPPPETPSDGGWPRREANRRTVAFIGDHPYKHEELAAAAPVPDYVRELTDERFIDTIVLGWEVDDIEPALARIDQWPRPARYIPQEGWLALVHLGTDWWLDDPTSLNRFADEGHPIEGVREVWPPEKPWPGTEVTRPVGTVRTFPWPMSAHSVPSATRSPDLHESNAGVC